LQKFINAVRDDLSLGLQQTDANFFKTVEPKGEEPTCKVRLPLFHIKPALL